MFTGYGPGVTGVDNLSFTDPIPDGLTIWERLDTVKGPSSWYNGAINAKYFQEKTLVGNAFPEIDYWFDPSMAPRPRDLYSVNAIKGYVIKNESLTFIDQYYDKNFFLFIHFADPDVNGHRLGRIHYSIVKQSLIVTDGLEILPTVSITMVYTRPPS